MCGLILSETGQQPAAARQGFLSWHPSGQTHDIRLTHLTPSNSLKTGNLTPNRSVLRELDSARGASAPDPVLRQGRQPVDRLGVHAKPFEKGRRYVAAAGPPVTHGPRSDGQ